jgi:hypothetical protein
VTKGFEALAILEPGLVSKDARIADVARAAWSGALGAVSQVVRVTQRVGYRYRPANVYKDLPPIDILEHEPLLIDL